MSQEELCTCGERSGTNSDCLKCRFVHQIDQLTAERMELDAKAHRLQLEVEFHQRKAADNYDYAEEQACRAHKAEVEVGRLRKLLAEKEVPA